MTQSAVEAVLEGWQQDFLHVTVVAAGSVTLGTWWRFDFRRGISPWRLYLNDSEGAALVMEDGSRWDLPVRTPVLVPPKARFQTRAWSPVRHVYLHFELVGLERDLERVEHPIPLPGSVPLRTMLEDIGRELLNRTVGGTEMLRLRAAALEATALAVRIVRREGRDTVAESAVYGPLRGALRLIQEEYARPISVEELADRAGLSRDHFIRRFRETMGLTPGRYLSRYRLRQAAERLGHANEGVETVAAACGFLSRCHFARAFRSEYGITPSEYRRSAATGFIER